MKRLAFIFLQLGIALTVQAMNERSKGNIKKYLLEYQESLNISCVLHYLDTFIDFGLLDNYNFQSKHGKTVGKLGSTCNIFICTSQFSESQESQEIDKAMKNHLWIIDGSYGKKHFLWPVIEVLPKISKLYCSKDPNPKLAVAAQHVEFCPEYPTWKGQDIYKLRITCF